MSLGEGLVWMGLMGIGSLALTAAAATGVWLLWTVAGLGAQYFTFLPAPLQHVPLLHVIGLFLVARFALAAFQTLSIKLGSS